MALSAYIFSEEHKQIWRMAEGVEAGVVGVNDSGVALVEGTTLSGQSMKNNK